MNPCTRTISFWGSCKFETKQNDLEYASSLIYILKLPQHVGRVMLENM